MADMGKLALQMSVNPGSFEQDLKKAASQVGSFGASVASIGSGQFSITGALSQLVGPAGLASIAFAGLGASMMAAGASGISFIAEIGGLARAFDLPVDQANNLALAAQRSGLEIETLSGALHRMNLSLGKAMEGAPEAIKAFHDIGFNARDLADMDANVAIGAIGDQLSTMGNEAKRTAAAAAIFGKGWAEIDPLLRRGTEGIEQAAKMAQRFGLNVNQVDTSNLRLMKQAGRDVMMAFEGLSLTIGRELIPIITMLDQGLVEFLADIKPIFDVIGQGIAVVRSLMGAVVDLFGGMKNFIGALAGTATGAAVAYAAYLIFSQGLAAVRFAMALTAGGAVALRTALMSTGVGLLVVGLGALIGFLTSTAGAASRAADEISRLQALGERGQGPLGGEMQAVAQRLAAARADLQANIANGPTVGQGELANRNALRARVDELTAQLARLERLTPIANRLLAENEAAQAALAASTQDPNQAYMQGLEDNQAKHIAEMTKSTEEYNASLLTQIATFGMAAYEARAYADSLAGIPAEITNATLALGEQKKLQDDLLAAMSHAAPEKKGAAAVEEGSSAAVSAINMAVLNSHGDRDDQQKRIEEVLKGIREKNTRQEQLLRDIKAVLARDAAGVNIA